MVQHLLTPSLSPSATPRTASLYSAQSALMLGFFMGPLPLIFYSALNSWRLRRPLDALAYLAAIGGIVLLYYLAMQGALPALLVKLSDEIGTKGSLRGLVRLYALLLWGGFYFMHRKEHRSTSLFGTTPSPWIAAIACSAAGLGIVYVVDYLLSGAGTV